jgi:hypothetical protein
MRYLCLIAAVIVAGATLPQRAFAQYETAPAPQPVQDTLDTAQAYAPSSVWNAQRVRRVLEDGTRVVLTDGTAWEVFLPDRPSVNTWKPGDLVLVREAAISEGDFDYTLKDGRTRRAVWVRLLGDVNQRI